MKAGGAPLGSLSAQKCALEKTELVLHWVYTRGRSCTYEIVRNRFGTLTLTAAKCIVIKHISLSPEFHEQRCIYSKQPIFHSKKIALKNCIKMLLVMIRIHLGTIRHWLRHFKWIHVNFVSLDCLSALRKERGSDKIGQHTNSVKLRFRMIAKSF